MKRFRLFYLCLVVATLFAACGDGEETYPCADGGMTHSYKRVPVILVDEDGQPAIASKGLLEEDFRVAYQRDGKFYVPEDEANAEIKLFYMEEDPAKPYLEITIKPEYCGLPPYYSDLLYPAPEEGETGKGAFRLEYNDGEWVSGPIGFTIHAWDEISGFCRYPNRDLLDVSYGGKTYEYDYYNIGKWAVEIPWKD